MVPSQIFFLLVHQGTITKKKFPLHNPFKYVMGYILTIRKNICLFFTHFVTYFQTEIIKREHIKKFHLGNPPITIGRPNVLNMPFFYNILNYHIKSSQCSEMKKYAKIFLYLFLASIYLNHWKILPSRPHKQGNRQTYGHKHKHQRQQ